MNAFLELLKAWGPAGALIVALTIPFALLFACIFLDLQRIPANLLSLGALDFGMVVDGSVVMVRAAPIVTVNWRLAVAPAASVAWAVNEKEPGPPPTPLIRPLAGWAAGRSLLLSFHEPPPRRGGRLPRGYRCTAH